MSKVLLKRLTLFTVLGISLYILLLFFGESIELIPSKDNVNKPSMVQINEIDAVKVTSIIGSEKFQVFLNGDWKDILIKGVNMGIAKPGYFPGEVAITKEEYARWFTAISEMNANAIRVYTIHPPAFYEALYEHNKKSDHPLFLFHGIWVNEELLLHENNAFAASPTNEFKKEIIDTINIIHGSAYIEKKTGHAGGRYVADISPYVIGWILGIEWDSHVVKNTNELNKGLAQFKGQYIVTENASPFERWLAEIMEYTTEYEYNQYGWQRPLSFTNWVTTDLLEHPSEPSEDEDLVEVNPNHILTTNNHRSGIFASYHIYPYYPDFLNYEPNYVNFVDMDGNKNNYAGYINDLHQAHNIPILVAEYGVPSSRGLTHENIYGMNQGFHDETEQGVIDAKLFKNIVDEGLAGGLVFTWQDEWFKRTWNTMDYDNPDKRPFWSNAQTNEQQFGLLSFDPGEEQTIAVDGEIEDWEKADIKAAYNNDNFGILKNVYVSSDERYIYMRIDYQDISTIDLNNINSLILLDIIENQGNTTIPELKNESFDFGIDFLIELNGVNNSRMLVDSYYDTFYYQYAHVLQMVPTVDDANQIDSGIFHPIRLALNKEMFIPSLNKTIPFSSYEAGKLLMGIGNPTDQEYNSLADFYINNQQKNIEIRIPWALLNVKDPSQREIMGNVWQTGLNGSKMSKGIGIGVIAYDSNKELLADSFPKMKNNQLLKENLYYYAWPIWKTPTYHERLKQSYYIMQNTFKQME